MSPFPRGRVFTLPGLFGSGPEHWQTRWELQHGFARVEQASWAEPSREAWTEQLARVLTAQRAPVFLIAHSLGCALLAHAASRPELRARIAGALLVAPADVDDPVRTPALIRGFAPLPSAPLGIRATLVASRDDPFLTFTRATQLAAMWQAQLVDAGAAGHINAESGLGDWPAGLGLLAALIDHVAAAESGQSTG
ncbi:MAG: alpha/beta hydrolase [Polyangiales bacterium]